jgi:cobalt/nickel transport system permease protein
MLLSALLGPYAGFLTMIAVLLIQCLLFADGGLLAFGCNVWNMAFYGCFVGALLIWRPMMKKGMSRGKIVAASILGCVLTLQLGAFSVTLETLASGITELPFTAFVAAMQPIHLAIGFVEGLITAAVLVFVYEARPELLYCSTATHDQGRFSLKGTVGILAACAAVIGGLLCQVASSNPDGLEWSLLCLTGSTELEATGVAYSTAASIQEATSLLPDYGFSGSESALGTTVSGLIGCVVVVAVCVAVCYLFKFFRKGKKTA